MGLQLVSLDVSANRFAALPDALARLGALAELRIARNQVGRDSSPPPARVCAYACLRARAQAGGRRGTCVGVRRHVVRAPPVRGPPEHPEYQML